MIVTLLLGGALLVEAPATKPYSPMTIERVDVAYQELAQGKTDEAIARIRANRSLDTDDPAAMINLGTAYARKGMTAEALACFKAAEASRGRVELELADGSWVDSRRAAQMAAARLDKAAFAAR